MSKHPWDYVQDGHWVLARCSWARHHPELCKAGSEKAELEPRPAAKRRSAGRLLKYTAGLYDSKTTKRLRGDEPCSLVRNGLIISWEDLQATAYVVLLHLVAAGLSSSALETLLQSRAVYATCGPRWLLKAIAIQHMRLGNSNDSDNSDVPVFGGDFDNHVLLHHQELHLMHHEPDDAGRHVAVAACGTC